MDKKSQRCLSKYIHRTIKLYCWLYARHFTEFSLRIILIKLQARVVLRGAFLMRFRSLNFFTLSVADSQDFELPCSWVNGIIPAITSAPDLKGDGHPILDQINWLFCNLMHIVALN